jgi:hypothetical protein
MGLSEDYEKLPLNSLNRMEYNLREISIIHIYIYIEDYSMLIIFPKKRYKRRHGAILWDTRTPLFVVENQMAKVPEPGSLTLRSEDWSVDGFDHETCGVYGQNCNVTICYYQNR